MSHEIELMPNERVVLSAHPHWWYFWKHVVAGVGVLALFALSLSVDGAIGTVLWWLTALAFIGDAGAVVYALLTWRSTSFAITDRRVAFQSGLFRRHGVSIPLTRVNNVNFDQTFLARLLGNGTVTIESAGDTGDSVFENIPDPEGARRMIFQQMEAHSIAESTRGANAIAEAVGRDVPGSTTASAEERLRELEALRVQGLLSEDEYVEGRNRILGSI